jgi:hypothetical protein
MVVLTQMAEFVDNHIIHYSVGRNDDPPVELNTPTGTATAPPTFESLDIYGGGGNPDDLGIPPGFLPKLLLCMFFEPLREGVSHPLGAIGCIG